MKFSNQTPLAERMRPQTLGDYVHQNHLVGEQSPIRLMIEQNVISSMIFWGPPGTGKTTLAEIIAADTGREFFPISAINAGVKEIRAVIEKAKEQSLFREDTPILFVDEIHRFSKSQQDSLLQAVEKGWVVLIGATTENPSFEVNSALLSRSQVYVLEDFDAEDLSILLNNALEKDEFLSPKNYVLQEKDVLIQFSGGDARKLYNGLETVTHFIDSKGEKIINNKNSSDALQSFQLRYDKNGENHYDIVSAFIKSMRGSDPDASVYWLARMIDGGEDVKFIARRMLIFAAEDIGLANPNALILAQNTFQAVNVIGYPEARIILSQCAIYLANSVKSNSAYVAIDKALAKVRETGNLAVPMHLRNAPTKLMKDLDYGKNYQYPHNFEGNWIAEEYMPETMKGEVFYEAASNPKEQQYKNTIEQRKQIKSKK